MKNLTMISFDILKCMEKDKVCIVHTSNDFQVFFYSCKETTEVTYHMRLNGMDYDPPTFESIDDRLSVVTSVLNYLNDLQEESITIDGIF